MPEAPLTIKEHMKANPQGRYCSRCGEDVKARGRACICADCTVILTEEFNERKREAAKNATTTL